MYMKDRKTQQGRGRRYFQLEGGESILCENVLCVLDLDACTRSAQMREFLKDAQQRLQVVTLASDLPQTVVVTLLWGSTRVYLSGLSADSICRRLKGLPAEELM